MNTPKRKNCIVFFTDQQRWDTTGIHGNPLDLTPNLDRMAYTGTNINHCFTCQPVCGPARSVIQTGMYPTTTGCYKNGVSLPHGIKTLAHYFKENGYRTGYIGKWHLANEEPVTEPNRGGYEYWLGANSLEHTSFPYDTTLYDNNNNPVKLPGYRVDALTDAAIRYIDENKKDPFFLFISYLEPHFQNSVDAFIAPDGYSERYTGKWIPPDLAVLGGSAHQHLGGYYGMVKRLDEAFGRLLDALKSMDIMDDTIILFTTDHGCHFKTRNIEYKRSGHESSIRIPAVFCGAEFNGGGYINKLVSLIDLPPTLLDAADIPIPNCMQGNSIMPLIRRNCLKWPNEVFIQISEAQVGRALRTQKWKYIVNAIEKDPRNDMCSEKYAEESLYDLESDPYELTNLIGFDSHQEVAQVMREKLLKRMVEIGEAAPIIEIAPKKKSGQRKVLHSELHK